MAEAKRFAVVTGANKGIGFTIVRQLASQGITVVLTARDEKRGLEALHELIESGGIAGDVLFHQLDVADSSSVASLAEFFKAQFGTLDILVNNARIGGANADGDAFRDSTGAARGNIPSEWAKGIFSDVNHLTEERVDEVLNEYLKDFKEGCLEANGWPLSFSAYIVSKAAMNAYTRIVAKKHQNMKVNCVCPGNVKTDINFHTGIFTVEEGAENIVRLALLSDDGPSGLFFIRGEVSPF